MYSAIKAERRHAKLNTKVNGYDTVLKSLLAGSENSLLEMITGARRSRWPNVELPEILQTRVDLLFETLLRMLISLELQSTNDPLLPLRMAEYSLRIYRNLQKVPQAICALRGRGKMRMPSSLDGPDHVCRYTIFDIPTLDAEKLLNSPFPPTLSSRLLRATASGRR